MQDGDAKRITRDLSVDAEHFVWDGKAYVYFSNLLGLEHRQAVISSHSTNRRRAVLHASLS